MVQFLRFWSAAFGLAWTDGRAMTKTGPGKVVSGLVVVVAAGLGLRYAEAALVHVGINLGPESLIKELLKAVVGVLASGVVVAALVVAWAVLIAPPLLWGRERKRAAILPFGAQMQLFRVKECWWIQPRIQPPTREAYVMLELTRDVKDAQLKLWAYHNGARIRLVHDETLTAPRGREVRLVLATAAIFDESSHGASRFPGGDAFTENEMKLVRIEMIAGKVTQDYRVMVGAMHTGQQRHMIVLAAENIPYFWPGP